MSHQITTTECYCIRHLIVTSDGDKKIELRVSIQQKLPKVDYVVIVNKDIKIITKRLDIAVETYNQY